MQSKLGSFIRGIHIRQLVSMLCFSCFLIIYTCTKLLSTTFLVKISLILIFFFLIDCLLIYLFRSDVQANLFHSSAFLDMFHMGFCAKKRCRFVDMCFRNNFCRVVRPCISQIIFLTIRICDEN